MVRDAFLIRQVIVLGHPIKGYITLRVGTLTISHLPAQFSDHKHCGSGGTFLICHVTSRDHVFKELRVESPDSKSLPYHWSSASGDMTNLICYVTSQDHVIEGSCDFMSGSSSLHVTILPSLMVMGIAAA